MSDIKTLRKQIKNVVQALLPEILRGEAMEAIRKENLKTLIKMQTDVQASLKEINDRSKDLQSFIMRSVAPKTPSAPVEGVKVIE